MPVNFEIKSQLAKLLAIEDLVVEHKKVSTACFNVHTRVLTLPMWEKASNVVYDMLVGHEVGHALYTSYADWNQDFKIPKSIMNIVEDARVEKLMKRRYPGIAKTFYTGYKELNDDDFLKVEGNDISKMNLADRANLWFKIGNYINVPINENEIEIINMIADAETFQDVVKASIALYEFCKNEELTKEQNVSDVEISNKDSENDLSSESMNSKFENNDDECTNLNSKEKELSDDNFENSNLSKLDDEFIPEVKTMDAMNDAIEKLINMDGNENHYLEIPKLDLNTVIIKNEDIHDYISDCWGHIEVDRFSCSDTAYYKFKNNSKKEVSYLVKEFECKKSADQYSRSTTSKTGVLNTSKLHTYKFNEDLFKKISMIPDGKNHGLIFILDWSGSMGNIMTDTIKQLYNILWFCRKVNIPFEVYAFTCEWNYKPSVNSKGITVYPQPHYKKTENVFCVTTDFSLLNMFSSKVNNKTLDMQMLNIFRISSQIHASYSRYLIPPKLSLSGTPLNESLISLHQIIPEFKTKNKLQKTHCIILTDGESSALNYHVEINRNYSDNQPYMGIRSVNANCFIRNRKTGMVYPLGNTNIDKKFTNILLHDLRETFPKVIFIGIRIVANRDSGYFIRSNSNSETHDKNQTKWKKERNIVFTESGYHKYFGISSSALSNEIEFNVDEDASKSTIRNAFKKSLNSKRMNKKFLNEFIELVA